MKQPVWSAAAVSFACGVVVMTMLTATDASAHKRFARQLGVRCRECHQAAEGGGPRTLVGQYYQATGSLPVDRSPAQMRLVESTVQRWMQQRLEAPPTVRWRRALPPAAPKTTGPPAAPWVVLRRASLDLRGTLPSPDELHALERGRPLAAFVDEWLEGEAFSTTFLRYHKDLVKPRSGIFPAPVSWSRLTPVRRGLGSAWLSERQVGVDGACDSVVDVDPWWDRGHPIPVCAASATGTTTGTTTDATTTDDCGSAAGQASGRCGCGPHLVHCYRDDLRERVVDSMEDELARQAMAIVAEGLPYSEVLTADWTVVDGALEVAYGMAWGTQATLVDADIHRSWHRIERHPRHSGGLSSPAFLNFFYNGRRWAQRVFEVYLCHDTFPDYDLLDDVIDAGETAAVPYRDSPDQMPSLTVTEGRACAACHLQLDGLARARDRWDQFGGYHEVMPGAGLPIPQSVVFDGKLVDGVDGLGRAMARSSAFRTCAVEQAFQHVSGRRFSEAEAALRDGFVTSFEMSGLNFKSLLRELVLSPTFASTDTVKLLRREQLEAAMTAATGAPWRVRARGGAVNRPAVAVAAEVPDRGVLDAADAAIRGDISGWDLYYDKVGGLDYRRIEQRDLRPSPGFALVQFQAARESCAGLVAREAKLPRTARRWLTMVDRVGHDDAPPPADVVQQAIDGLYRRGLSRPSSDVTAVEREALGALYTEVAGAESGAAAWTAVCTAILSSTAFAIY